MGLGVVGGFGGSVSSGAGSAGTGAGAGAGVVTGAQAPSNTHDIRNTPTNVQALWFLINTTADYELPGGSIIAICRSFVNLYLLPLPLSSLLSTALTDMDGVCYPSLTLASSSFNNSDEMEVREQCSSVSQGLERLG